MKKPTSCKCQAMEVSAKTEEVLRDIVKSGMTPEEDSALFLHTSIVILKQIMYNTAIIADYIIDKQLKGGTN